jgi:N-acyl-D-aspartate/D-glutamate deacylase
MADLIIRNGTIVDGTGAPRSHGDVEITDGVITAVGPSLDSSAGREIDADGLLVTPGWVDIHTHFDGQVTWDPIVAPSSWHGVTTIGMGNCGVGFAPASPDRHEWLISLLEGVEDIPGSALAEGLTWDWETFPQYLDSLAAKPHTVDIGAHVPHSALRTYVMGERGADPLEVPTEGDLARMATMLREALDAGAIGFATSRTEVHKTSAGAPIPTLRSGAAELLTLADAMRESGTGVIQLISDLYQTPDDSIADAELELLGEVVRHSARPLSFTMQQAYHSPDRWRYQMAWVDRMVAEGHDVKAQVAPRPIGVLLGLTATANPFVLCQSWGELAFTPMDERVAALRDPERRRRVLEEHAALASTLPDGLLQQIVCRFDVMFRLTDPVDYQLDASRSLGADAQRLGARAAELVYDTLLEEEGRRLLYLPLFNFAHGNFDDIESMITSPNIVFGLSDAGAHCGTICDGSMPTSALTVWSRDRRGGEPISLERMVHQSTQRTASHVGWMDRGVIAQGYVADLNVIDLEALGCAPPRIVADLPAGGRRLVQDAHGYRFTIKSGAVTFEDGEHTGELPGELLRGTRPRP